MPLDWDELGKLKDPMEISEREINRYRSFSRECDDTLEAIRAAKLLYWEGVLTAKQCNKIERTLKKKSGYRWLCCPTDFGTCSICP
jgi:hypothetical protein